MRVLIADDDPSARAVLSSTLQKLGHEVTTVNNGEEAWRVFQELRPSLLITDWLMPEKTGIELAALVRTEAARTYILVVTSLSGRERSLEAFQAGADDLLVKPIDVDQITARVRVAERQDQAEHNLRERAVRDALESIQKALGPEHTALLDNLRTLSDYYQSQRAYGKARAFLRRQIDIARSADDAATATRLRAELVALRDVDDEALDK